MDEKEITILENVRAKALRERDSVKYFKSCNKLGIEPEDLLLYEQGQVDSRTTIRSNLEKLSMEPAVPTKKPRKRKGSKTGISVRLAPIDAKEVYDNFSFGKENLKSLIDKYVPRNTRKSVDEMNYTELRRYGHVIFGVAKKELKK